MINLRGCTEPASEMYEAVIFRTRSIGSSRPSDLVRNTHGTARLSRVFYRSVAGRWESEYFGHGLSRTVQKFCKTLCGLVKRLPTGSARDFQVTEAF